MGKIIHQPFDLLVKTTLHNIERAKEFLEAHLSDKAKKYIDLDKGIQLVNKEFVKKEYRTLRCDIVYQVNINNQKGYIYCQVEAQSKPEKLLPLRILNYNLELITWHWENKKKEIPPIANLVLYNGIESPYPYKIKFLDLLNDYKVAQELLLEGTTLIDLTIHEDEEIEKHKKTALMELLLKHSRQRDFFNYLQNLKKSGKFKLLLNYYDDRYVEGILLFVTEILNSKDHSIEQVVELFTGISLEIDKEIMTVRQAIEHRGMQKGRQEGMQVSRKVDV